MERRTFLAVLGAVTAASLSGCTGGERTTATPTATPTATETATETATATGTATPTPTPESVGQREYPDYNWEALADAEAKPVTEIAMREVAFHPMIAEVPKGAGVRFVNEDSFAHTVTVPALDIDEQVDGGASVELTFSETGTFDYVCTFHPPGMLGRLVVTEATLTETPTATPTPTRTTTTTSGGGGGGGDGGGGGYY